MGRGLSQALGSSTTELRLMIGFLYPTGAASWVASSTGLTTLDTRSLAVPGDGSALFAGTLGGGVFLSTNAGATWVRWSSGLYGDWVHAFAVTDSSIYAPTVGGSFVRPLG